MGRPALKVVLTTVRLPEGVASKIDAAAGKTGARAEFIRRAIDAALAKDAASSSAKAAPNRAGGSKSGKAGAAKKSAGRKANKAAATRTGAADAPLSSSIPLLRIPML